MLIFRRLIFRKPELLGFVKGGSKMAHREKKEGRDRFEEFYNDVYGQRWQSLKSALLKESSPVSLSDRLTQPYYMDSASIQAASFLPVKQGDTVLDMCAAPGGKTLVIALKLDGNGHLVSNDRSSQRRIRLHNVIKNCLDEKKASIISVTGHDSTKWGLYEKNVYDCILLDAPCSSERHVLADEKALAIWGPNRPKVLAMQQFAMLAAALDAAKPGGYILYSTCSINPMENSMVIEKLHLKRHELFTEIPLETHAEKLDHGYIFLPDTSNGTGPLYFCLLKKSTEVKENEI